METGRPRTAILALPPGPAELEMLAEDEERELLEKLEFFRWLETEAPQVVESGGSA